MSQTKRVRGYEATCHPVQRVQVMELDGTEPKVASGFGYSGDIC